METGNITTECAREAENCLYTSTTLLIWLRFLRAVKVAFVVAPLIFGFAVTWRVLSAQDTGWKAVVVAVLALAAGVMPAIYAALRYDEYLSEARHLAGEFKNLQDRFHQLAILAADLEDSDLLGRFELLMDRLDAARSPAITAPEWCFRRAQKKVRGGDYAPDRPPKP